MKKRSMLAIASLATGFVVAAVTPSHALGEDLNHIDVDKTLSTLDHTVASDSLDGLDESALGQNG
ncbi:MULTISPECIES: hypothetical protein [unclassified Streptomyces]|jgi:hypothetical protein|uniref:hypothetical protein n=1 Tax=unclassified Streptomyces TaxID=2593676 RepID=UPI000F501804|nr:MULTISPECIES: hypothetical protein [unclassified Streptomyces]MDH6447887.1 hypothetical protein [Streptomyces sp. SAI-119]MDH6501390.1 hypothetical protein [Streptomyces sp. SAI-149]QUC60171.1 hypothetical protein IOD14_27340 [Streptomyces sp. A2-16]